jgi:REP element-mobilizing transposase RayT
MFRNRKSIRLKNYNYSQPGAYYVTICAQNRKCLFGEIYDGKMVLNEYGEIVQKEWRRTEKIRKNIELDKFIIMPNHIHGIINIVGTHCNVPLQNHDTPSHNHVEKFGHSTPNSIPTIIKLFKSTTTRQINVIRNTPGVRVYQRNYYERIIRNKFGLNRIRRYILDNPANWENDKYYTK